jgi:hypothetical protein
METASLPAGLDLAPARPTSPGLRPALLVSGLACRLASPFRLEIGQQESHQALETAPCRVLSLPEHAELSADQFKRPYLEIGAEPVIQL